MAKLMLRLALMLALLPIACGGAVAPPGTGGGTVPPSAPPTSAPHAPSEILVMLEDPDDDDEADDLRDDFGGLELRRIADTPVFVLTLPPGADLDQVLKDLDDDVRVLETELNYLGEAPEGGPVNIPTLGSETLAAISGQDALRDLGLAQAHQVTRGAGIVVAVVDTGVDATHPFLQGVLHASGFDFVDFDPDPSDARNFVDDDNDGLVDEQFGHGTFVASLIHAVAPEAEILAVRALDAEGIGTASSVALGIIYAVDQGAHVINVSVDIPFDPEVVKQAVDYAADRGVLVVAAAGNDGTADVIFPARYGDALAVSAVGPGNIVPTFANHGSAVDLVGPGVDVVGAVPLSLNATGTARWSGTSFAAPVVAGAAALVRAAFPGLDEDDVRDRLTQTATPVDGFNPGLEGRLGHGLIDLVRAVTP